ncbi:MAG: SNF2-related protein [Pseudorhodobacter sp.]|nr:SNF2-related protein [Pseudorhodobacter sp.]
MVTVDSCITALLTYWRFALLYRRLPRKIKKRPSVAADRGIRTAIRLLRSPPEGLDIEAATDVLHSGKIAAEELPAEIGVPGLHADLFPYQAKGIQWMWETVNRTGGLILADEMGLGKTLQIIALLLLEPPEKPLPH